MAEELLSYVDIEIRSKKAEEGSRRVQDALGGIDKAQTKAGQGAHKFQEDVGRIGKKRKTVKSVGTSFERLGESIRGASTKLGGFGAGFDGVANSMSGFRATGGGTLALIAAIGAAAVGAAMDFSTFEQAVADLSSITGALGDDLKYLSDQARAVGKETSLSASEAAKAFELMASAKPDLLSNAEALAETTRQAVLLAEAAGVALPEAAQTVGNALNQFGEEADQASRYVNVLAAGSKYGASQVAQTAEALKVSGVSAAGASVSFETLNAAIQTLSTVGIAGSQAGTSLRNVILKLESEAIKGATPSVDGLANSLEALGEQNMTAAEMTKLFGLENVNATQALINNTDKLRKLEEQMTGTNVAQEQADIRTSTLIGSFKNLGSTLEELSLILVGDTGLGGLIQLLVDSFNNFVKVVNYSLGGLIKLTKFLGEVSGITKILTAEIPGTSGAIGFLADNFEALAIIVSGSAVKALSYFGEYAEKGMNYALLGAAKLKNGFLDLNIAILELAQKGGKLLSKIFGIDFVSANEAAIGVLQNMKTDTKALEKEIENVGAEYADFRAGIDDFIVSSTEDILAKKRMEKGAEGLAEKTEEAKEKVEDLSTGTVEFGDAVKDILSDLQYEIDLMGKSEREAAILAAQKSVLAEATDAEKAAIAELAGALYDLTEAQKAQEKADKEAEAARKKSASDFEKLKEDLQSEEQAIQSSYDRRLKIILDNTEKGSEARKNLTTKLNKDFGDEALGDFKNPNSFQDEIDRINEFYEARKELILNNVSITETERTALEEQLTRERNERIKQLEAAKLSTTFQNSAQLFDGLAGLTKAYGGEQSKAYKAMFAASKAFAIADSIVKIQTGIANAAANPWPTNLAAMASVVAATGSIISTISGTNYAGAYDKGGNIPAGKVGLVGEIGPEFVRGPATVTGREDTMNLMKKAAKSPVGPSKVENKINVINSIDPSVMEGYLSSEAGVENVLNIIRDNPEVVSGAGGY